MSYDATVTQIFRPLTDDATVEPLSDDATAEPRTDDANTCAIMHVKQRQPINK
jgi:hypothetical protein